jgi:hypothetical protein
MTTQTETPSTRSRLIPLTKWNAFHEWPPQGGLRHLVFNANANGFDKVVRRCGKRVLIDESAFFQWVDAQNGRAVR